jgi:hypothetical protein
VPGSGQGQGHALRCRVLAAIDRQSTHRSVGRSGEVNWMGSAGPALHPLLPRTSPMRPSKCPLPGLRWRMARVRPLGAPLCTGRRLCGIFRLRRGFWGLFLSGDPSQLSRETQPHYAGMGPLSGGAIQVSRHRCVGRTSQSRDLRREAILLGGRRRITPEQGMS